MRSPALAGDQLGRQRALAGSGPVADDRAALDGILDERLARAELRRQKDSGIWQLFTHDPNGAKVELDFDPAESL